MPSPHPHRPRHLRLQVPAQRFWSAPPLLRAQYLRRHPHPVQCLRALYLHQALLQVVAP